MNNIFFYILLGIILYFIFTRVLENFTQSQENFDPSLVPVSSIVTLAKVAQKLVNGNGTLTNPGNLQIGASTSTPGNLTVTGNSTVNGNTTVGGTLGVTGNITVGGTMDASKTTVRGELTVNERTQLNKPLTINPGAANARNTLNLVPGGTTTGESHNYINFMREDGLNYNTWIMGKYGEISVQDNLYVPGKLSTGGLIIKVGEYIKSSDGIERLWFGNNNHTAFGSATGVFHWHKEMSGNPLMTLNDGRLNVNKELCIGSTCINETQLRNLLRFT